MYDLRLRAQTSGSTKSLCYIPNRSRMERSLEQAFALSCTVLFILNVANLSLFL